MRIGIVRISAALAGAALLGVTAGYWVERQEASAEVAEESAFELEIFQVESNTEAKGDRQAVAVALAPVTQPQSDTAFDGGLQEPEQETHTATIVSLPREKPKPPPAPRAEPPNGLLTDAQIANIKTRLRLTAAQEAFWPPIEQALRDVVKVQLREAKRRGMRDAPPINAQSPEVQRLTSAAIPLLMRMREDQKNEVRKLARVIGLNSVASQI